LGAGGRFDYGPGAAATRLSARQRWLRICRAGVCLRNLSPSVPYLQFPFEAARLTDADPSGMMGTP